jgi:hypothetical protein
LELLQTAKAARQRTVSCTLSITNNGPLLLLAEGAEVSKKQLTSPQPEGRPQSQVKEVRVGWVAGVGREVGRVVGLVGEAAGS